MSGWAKPLPTPPRKHLATNRYRTVTKPSGISLPLPSIALTKVARAGYKVAGLTEAVQKKEKAPSQLSLAGGFYRAVSTESLSLQRRTTHHPQQCSLNKIDPVAK
jgi:hypothetical protein